MEQLYQDYKDVAEFFLIYITEAHAIDDRYPVGYAKELGIKEHTTYPERCIVAERLVSDKTLAIPCLVDNIENTTQEAYKAWPNRVFLVRTDGRIGVAASRGPFGYKPGRERTREWLAEFRETGKEPPLPTGGEVESGSSSAERMSKVGELTGKMMELRGKGETEQALEVGLEALKQAEALYEQDDSLGGSMVLMARYNVACMYSLLGRKDQAFEHLSKLATTSLADDFGSNRLGQIESDADFDNIRDDPRYAKLIAKIKN